MLALFYLHESERSLLTMNSCQLVNRGKIIRFFFLLTKVTSRLTPFKLSSVDRFRYTLFVFPVSETDFRVDKCFQERNYLSTMREIFFSLCLNRDFENERKMFSINFDGYSKQLLLTLNRLNQLIVPFFIRKFVFNLWRVNLQK